MTHKVFLAVTAAIALFVSAEAGVAFPIAPMQAAPTDAVTKVTFWGKPFPYGYSWRRHHRRGVVSYRG
jgi:hypothetical protein